MVTIQQARKQIAETRKKLSQARQQAKSFDPKIRQSQTQLRQATRESQKDIRKEEVERGTARQQALAEIGKESQRFEAQAQPIEQEIKRFEASQSALASVRHAYKKKGLYGVGLLAQFGEGSEKEIAQEFMKDVKQQRDLDAEYNKRLKTALDNYNEGDLLALDKYGGLEKLKNKGIIEIETRTSKTPSFTVTSQEQLDRLNTTIRIDPSTTRGLDTGQISRLVDDTQAGKLNKQKTTFKELFLDPTPQRIVDFSGRWTEGTDYLSSKITGALPSSLVSKSDAGISRFDKKTGGVVSSVIVPTAMEIAKDLPLLFLLSPTLSTGATKKGSKQVTVKEKGKGKVNVRNFDRLFEEGSDDVIDKVLKDFKKTYANKGADSRKIAIDNIKALLDRQKSLGNIKGYVINSQTGQIELIREGIMQSSGVSTTVRLNVDLFSGTPTMKQTPLIMSAIKDVQLGKMQDIGSDINKNLDKTRTLFGLNTGQGQKVSTALGLSSLSSTQQALRLDTSQSQSYKTALSSLLKYKTLQKTQQVLRQEQKYRQKQQTKTDLNLRLRGKIPLFLPEDELDKKSKTKEIAEKILEFEAFGKRFGQEFSLGKAETKKGAEKKLKGFLKGTLGASGKVTQEGKPLSFGQLSSFGTGEFRPAKSDMFKVVQKRGFRLGTFGERTEIKRAKKKKNRKTNWFS